MSTNSTTFLTKLKWSLPWLTRYPMWRAREIVRRRTENVGPVHLIFIIANHFEPAWNDEGLILNWSKQLRRVDEWCEKARRIGESVRDSDGTPFRHTYFYPGEQYHPRLLERIAKLQADGFGEVEVHLHHGVEEPDTAANLRKALEDFRDVLAEQHQCLSRLHGGGSPMYAFIHGNWALANSASGRFCGVDEEMQILADTGCYADLTLPSVPDESQVPQINAIYECGLPLHERSPHRLGKHLQVGKTPKLPILITGPLVFNWTRRLYGLPLPRMDDGSLAANYPLDLKRLGRWQDANIGVKGRPEWIFIKLFGHGFFPFDQSAMIEEPVQRFFESVMEVSAREQLFKIHFATAREAFNIVMAAVDGRNGNPHDYRDYKLQSIMQETPRQPEDVQLQTQTIF